METDRCNTFFDAGPPEITPVRERFDLNTPELSFDEMKIVLDHSPTGIAIIKNRVIGWANRIFYSMLGHEFNGLRGKNTRCLYETDAEYERVGRSLYMVADKYGNALIETRLVRKDQNTIDCRIRASKLDKTDPAKGFIVVVTDISELKLLQIQLQQAQKMEAIGVLAGGISHDFNNILMGIQGHLSLMQIDITSVDKVTSHTKHINRLVKTAAELTSRLLGFARGGKYQIKTLDANHLLTLTLAIFKPTRKDITIHENYDSQLYPVDADPSQLEQVFLNLLINASQAIPEQGDIYICSQNIQIAKDHGYPFEVRPGPYIKITITDTGIGMDSETQKKIFDPFFSTKEIGDKKGRGLGLSTVFGVVKNHGGFILVDSKKGRGASFHICLPARTNHLHPKKEEGLKPFEQIQKGSETILLVDDEEDVLNVGKNFLEKLGYTPIIARNGLEAVEIYKLYQADISLIVLDLIMPVMSGKEAFTQIKEIQPNARILISTGYAVDDRVEGFLNKGCHGFLQKPFSLNEFAGALRKILDTV